VSNAKLLQSNPFLLLFVFFFGINISVYLCPMPFVISQSSFAIRVNSYLSVVNFSFLLLPFNLYYCFSLRLPARRVAGGVTIVILDLFRDLLGC
jgi:hypothetical protein